MEFSLAIQGPFSLQESARFLARWPPAEGIAVGSADGIRLAFALDRYRGHAGVHVRQEGDAVVGEVFGSDDVGAARAQVARVLSLDHDASDYPRVGERDPVVGRLQRERPGFRPVLPPDDAKLAALAETWRPYRGWVAALVRTSGSGA